MGSSKAEPRWIAWLEWIGLIALVALAAYLRFWRIEEVPPGFNSDEAVGAMGALTTLRQGLRYSYEGQGGAGALGFYFAAASFYIFGPSIAAIRGVAAWAGAVSIFANYWAIRELFRLSDGLNRARWVALLSTLGLAVSWWHISASRIAFAAIGVPFLMLPSVYFLWLGLNKGNRWWPFAASGLFLGGLMYIYLSGVFAPPFYAAFFVLQWLLVKLWQNGTKNSEPASSTPSPPAPLPQGEGSRASDGGRASVADGAPQAREHSFQLKCLEPAEPYLTRQFWHLFVTALVAGLLLLPMVYVLLIRPELEPGTTRVSQAFFLNPRINQGDPWGLLGRSIIGNLGAYGVSLSWLIGAPPPLMVPVSVGLAVFLGFLISLWHGLRGRAPYLFMVLWYPFLLLPSILSPDAIPHNLRTIGATTPTYVFAAVFVVWVFGLLWAAGRRFLLPSLGQKGHWAVAGSLSLVLAAWLGWTFWQENARHLYQYFYVFPETNDAQAAYHVYAVKLAEEINREPRAEVAFILPRNTAAGDVFRNFTTDFLTELAQPPAAHYWVIDDEKTITADLTAAAAEHSIMRVVKWKTSKHTGADPKEVLPYYLEKYGHYERTDSFEYYDIHTYALETPAPDFGAGEKLQATQADFSGRLRLAGFGLGDAGEVAQVNTIQAAGNDWLWLRLAWQKTGEHTEDLKVAVLVYGEGGQLISQIDKLLVNNFWQVGSAKWEVGAQEDTYFLIPIPPATPPGRYTLKIAVYGAKSLTRLPLVNTAVAVGAPVDLLTLSDFTVIPARKPFDAETLYLSLAVRQELLPGLTLVGFETLPGKTVRSGEQVGASLIWLAGPAPLAGDLEMSLIAKAGEGEQEWPLSEPIGLAGPGYPTSRWQPGELLRGWLMARVPPSFDPGLYKLRLRLAPKNDPSQEVLVLPIGDFQVEGWPRVFDPPRPQVKLAVDFNGQVSLVGVDMNGQEFPAGGTLEVRLYWRPEVEFAQNYTAFVHLIGPDGRLYGQVDHVPGAGAFPTTGWLPGEYIADAYEIPVSENAPAGEYQLEIGLYNAETGQRLPVAKPDCQGETCQDDKVLLPGLKVK